jgi:hypothetical protein
MRSTAQEHLDRYGLVPSDADLPAIRRVLAHEAQLERDGRGDEREDELALLCCVQLFARGSLEDVRRIWSAKQAGFDLGCAIDVQLLCGAGLEPTKRALAGPDGDPEALAYLLACEQSGDFDDFSTQGRLSWYRRYFGA